MNYFSARFSGPAVVARPLCVLLAGLWLALLPLLALANGPAGNPAPRLAGALRPDGTLRPEARGSFDAKGFEMLTAPDGHPVFKPSGAKGTLGAGDERWQDKFSVPGLNGFVYALVVALNGDILAGGRFTDAGGNANADYVARWNGTAW